ncbi:MAG TPA: hypothetical protein VEZ50_15925 [Nodosilinea sp.]|nr:hypothetical protein [Nodosilinea sp.]
MPVSDEQLKAAKAPKPQGFTPQHPSNGAPAQADTRPTDPAAEQPSAGPSECKAMANSTAVAHALKNRLTQDVQKLQALQGAYANAVFTAADQASDLVVAGISGDLFWGTVGQMTEEKLAALPKHEEVSFDVAQDLEQLKLPAWKPSGATSNRYLTSVPGSFGEYTNPYADPQLPPAA